jgi:lipopolysaccharide transport system ATP-binding protein
MNDNIAIKVSNLSKHYKLYDKHTDRFKEALSPTRKKYHKNYKALDNINFEIKKGEAVGIIGRNGAGKSTLLKIITGVLTQTSGEVQVNGRIASLLELGAGFNPELTGYDNIYFNASLLGLSDEEIDNKLESILSFADIGDYIYQPVKTYSSGMYVRLAFAVISHIDADILIIDEALAVGDAVFVQKCMSFIRNFIKEKTLLFVSHDNSAVIDICNNAVWLDNAKIKYLDTAKNVCDEYLYDTLNQLSTNIVLKKDKAIKKIDSSNNSKNNEVVIESNLLHSKSLKSGYGEIIDITLEHKIDTKNKVFKAGDKVQLSIKAKIIKEVDNPILGFIVKDSLGRELFGENTYNTSNSLYNSKVINCKIEAIFTFSLPILQNGEYVIMVSLANGDPYAHTQHHYVYDSMVMNILHDKLVFGIMNIPFENIEFKRIGI